MSTEDCKQLIESVAEQYLLHKNDKWKRTRKYKENDLTLRDFKGISGDVVVICESEDETIGLYNIELVNDGFSDVAMTCLNKDTLVKELTRLSQEYLQKDFTLTQNDEVYHAFFLIREMDHEDTFVSEALPRTINFDTENIEMYYGQKEDISYLRINAGGDWEQPIQAFVYWSERDKRLKGFFPCGIGNTYNMKTNTAYGSEDDPELYEEIAENIDYEQAERNGFEQLKKQLAREYQGI